MSLSHPRQDDTWLEIHDSDSVYKAQKAWPEQGILLLHVKSVEQPILSLQRDLIISCLGEAKLSTPHPSSSPLLFFYSSPDTFLLPSLYKLATVINASLLVPSCLDFIRQEQRSSPLGKNKCYYYEGMKTPLLLGCWLPPCRSLPGRVRTGS